MSAIVIGVDPGLDGALCLLGPDVQKVLDLPTKHDDVNGRRIDCVALAALLQQHIPAGARVLVCLEAMANGGMGKNRTSASTVGSQFWTQSAIVNTVEILGLEVAEYVPPQRWKKLYGLGGKGRDEAANTMREARQKVADLYPGLADFVQRQKDHNRAESVLIAHWFKKCRA